MLRRLRALGLHLEFMFGSNHWRVVDPGTGAFLTTVSSTPSDGNFYHQIRRDIAKAGYSWEGKPRKKIKKPKAGEISSLDLEALGHAQRMARMHGEREPQLEDLNKSMLAQMRRGFNEQEIEEAISNMPVGVDSGRAHRVISRLLNMVEKRGAEMSANAKARNPKIKGGAIAQELAYQAKIAAEKRGMRYWKTPESALNSLNNILSGTSGGITSWVADLIEAAMDELDGLQWSATFSKPKEQVAADNGTASTPVITLEEAKVLLMDVMDEDWTLRSEIVTTLVPEQMSMHKFTDGLNTLFSEGRIERLRENKKQGGMLYKLAHPEVILIGEDPEPPTTQEVELPELEPYPLRVETPEQRSFVQAMVGGSIADRYADTLLAGLEQFIASGSGDWRLVEPILSRLDKLAGVNQE